LAWAYSVTDAKGTYSGCKQFMGKLSRRKMNFYYDAPGKYLEHSIGLIGTIT